MQRDNFPDVGLAGMKKLWYKQKVGMWYPPKEKNILMRAKEKRGPGKNERGPAARAGALICTFFGDAMTRH